MACEVPVYAFWKEALAAALPTACQGRPPALRLHTGTEPVLLFPGSFRALQCAFHSRIRDRRDGAGYVKEVRRVVNWARSRLEFRNANCQGRRFLE